MEIKGKKLAVLGLSAAGISMVKALARLGAQVTAFGWEGAERNRALEQELKKLRCQVVFGEVPKDALFSFDGVVLSPNSGLYFEAFEAARERGIPAWTDVEWVIRANPAKTIAVTGSCGKTTTAGMILQMLKKQGFNAGLLGGDEHDLGAFLLQKKKLDYLVLEISSTRLKETTSLKPHIAVLLNIFPAHGERHHGSLLEYAEAKARIFENQTAEDFLVFDAHANNLHELIRQKAAKAALVRFSIESKVEPPGVYYEAPDIHAIDAGGKASKFSLSKSRARTYPTNIMNLMAATAVARLCGVQDAHIQAVIDAFRFLPGRLRTLRKLDGVLFIDDSKACNIGATIWALHSFNRPILWIVGGEMNDGARLNRLPTYALGKVKRALLVGSQTSQLAAYLQDLPNVVEVGSLRKAVELANQVAEAGDLVLFSPACPPDRFDAEAGNERGETFRKTVQGLPRTPRLNMRQGNFVRI